MYNIGCDKPLGVQSGWVENSQMRASSAWSNTHAAWRGRLNMPKQYSYPGAWSARANNADQWLEVRERDWFIELWPNEVASRSKPLPYFAFRALVLTSSNQIVLRVFHQRTHKELALTLLFSKAYICQWLFSPSNFFISSLFLSHFAGLYLQLVALKWLFLRLACTMSIFGQGSDILIC